VVVVSPSADLASAISAQDQELAIVALAPALLDLQLDLAVVGGGDADAVGTAFGEADRAAAALRALLAVVHVADVEVSAVESAGEGSKALLLLLHLLLANPS
jgi:hypothetical protein